MTPTDTAAHVAAFQAKLATINANVPVDDVFARLKAGELVDPTEMRATLAARQQAATAAKRAQQ